MKCATALLSMSVAIAACGSSAPTSDSGLYIDAAPTRATACAAVAGAACNQLQVCSPTDLVLEWGTLDICIARQTLACTEKLSAPGTAADPYDEELCATELSAETCAVFLAGLTPPPNCVITAGSGATGVGCEQPSQCASTYCAIANDAVCGTCATAPIAGASCASLECGVGMTCNSTTLTCEVPSSMNASCANDAVCGDGLTCVGATMTVAGVCKAQATMVGASCDATHATAADCSLDDGLVCDSTTSLCANVALAAAGSACGSATTNNTPCRGGAACVSGTCVATAGDGGACDLAAGPQCLAPAVCVVPPASGGTAGTCTLPGAQTCM